MMKLNIFGIYIIIGYFSKTKNSKRKQYVFERDSEYPDYEGHVFRLDEDGNVDFFYYESGYHNGPGCVKCGKSWCEHCSEDLGPCTAYKELIWYKILSMLIDERKIKPEHVEFELDPRYV